MPCGRLRLYGLFRAGGLERERMAPRRVTVFGGSGFLGRQIVKSLAAEGMNVRVGVRHPGRASFLERFGRSGQIDLVHADVWDESTVAEAVKQSRSVINTVGHYVEKGGVTFDAVHGQGALHGLPLLSASA